MEVQVQERHLAMEFLVKGAKKYDEPGIFMAFGEKNSYKREFTNF